MPAKSSSLNDPALRASMTDKVSEAASQVKDKVSNLGQSAVDTIDENRESAAGGLESAAQALHEKADSLPGGEKVASLARSTAEKLSSTAEYVRQHDVQGMMTDVEQLVKKNPGPSLLAAAVIGFLIGRAFSSND
ncbi:MAG: hypothetical protein JOZ32_08905 [Bryobacterales bacterium]|nr:hypothetical protein [Bryobacterales bacterium]